MRNHVAHALFLTTVLLAPCANSTCAQVPTAYDYTRITPANPRVGKLLELDNDTIAAAQITLLDLLNVEFRYPIRGLTPEQLATRFDVVSKIDPPGISSPEHNPHAQTFVIDALLKNHFQLKAHQAVEEVTFQELRSNPASGIKFTFSQAPCAGTSEIDTSNHIASQRMSMSRLATLLSKQLHAYVRDQTDLPGRYVIDLNWSQEAVALHLPPQAAPQLSVRLPSMSSQELLQLALSSQLGVYLSPGHETKTVVIIDYIELPANVIWLPPNADAALSSAHDDDLTPPSRRTPVHRRPIPCPTD
jgi:uncharacterized protein (TIGR03435 family)